MAFLPSSPLLSNRVLLLAKVETTYNVDSVPTVGSDAFLVDAPDFSVEPNVLERNFAHASLSPLPISIGRKLAKVTFKHELKGSGANQTVSKLGPLLRGCGFKQTLITNVAGSTNGTAAAATTNTSPAVTFTNSGASTVTGRYRIRVEKAGASAVAKMRVEGTPGTVDDSVIDIGGAAGFSASASAGATTTIVQSLTAAGDYGSIVYTVAGTQTTGDIISAVVGGTTFRYTLLSTDTTPTLAALGLSNLINADGRFTSTPAAGVLTVTFIGAAAAVVVTTAVTSLALGASGASYVPSWTGSLVLGDYWDILLLQPGVHYTPISTGFESLTIYMYRDGLLHKVTGCMGNVTFDGQAGNYGSATFTYTGQYIAPLDIVQPTSGIVFESTIPSQIEQAKLALNGTDDFCVQQFQFDMQNTVSTRDCANASDGFNGVRITGRSPQGSVNPETTLESTHPFWALMAAATILSFGVRIGTQAGNTVWIFSDSVQYGAIKYGNRNNILTYDVPLRLSQWDSNGDNEIRIVTS